MRSTIYPLFSCSENLWRHSFWEINGALQLIMILYFSFFSMISLCKSVTSNKINTLIKYELHCWMKCNIKTTFSVKSKQFDMITFIVEILKYLPYNKIYLEIKGIESRNALDAIYALNNNRILRTLLICNFVSIIYIDCAFAWATWHKLCNYINYTRKVCSLQIIKFEHEKLRLLSFQLFLERVGNGITAYLIKYINVSQLIFHYSIIAKHRTIVAIYDTLILSL